MSTNIYGKSRDELNNTMKLRDVFDEAQYVKIDHDLSLAFVWKGGHSINIYQMFASGEEIHKETDVFNVGDFKEDEATLEEVKEGIKRKINYIEEELNG